MFGLSLPSIVCRRTRVLLFGVFFVAPNGVLHYLTIWVPWRVSYNCLPFAVFDGIRVARLFLVSCVVLCFEFLLVFFFVLCIMCQMLSGMKLLTRTFIYQLQTTIDHVVSITNEMWLTGQQFGLQIMREFKSAKLFMMDLLRYSNDFCAIDPKCKNKVHCFLRGVRKYQRGNQNPYVYRRRTDNTMAKRKQTTIYKTYI